MDVLQNAIAWANSHHPSASIQHKAAFANSVSYLVTGGSGGLGGPSLREHLCAWSLAGNAGSVEAIAIAGEAMTLLKPDGSLPMPGQWLVDAAIAFCEPLCFGEVEPYRNTLLQIQEREYCFDDDSADLEALKKKCA
jgi:hypothetical protein